MATINRRTLIALSVTLSLSVLSDTAHAQLSQGQGLIFLDRTRYRSIPLAPIAAIPNLPREADLSASFPTPGNQGRQGSCVGWAVAYALKSHQERQERGGQQWNPTNTYSPSYVYNQFSRGSCQRGMLIVDALNLLSEQGVPSLERFPYDEDDCILQPTAQDRDYASPNRIATWFRVNVQDVRSVKAHIATGSPVIIGMLVDSGFRSLGEESWSGLSGGESSGHAVVVVGYSDERRAFRILNSWGTDWGDGGFGWLSYDAFINSVREGYSVQDLTINTQIISRPDHTPYASQVAVGPSVLGVRIGMQRLAADQFFRNANSTRQDTNSLRNTYSNTIDLDNSRGRMTYRVDNDYDYVNSISVTYDAPWNSMNRGGQSPIAYARDRFPAALDGLDFCEFLSQRYGIFLDDEGNDMIQELHQSCETRRRQMVAAASVADNYSTRRDNYGGRSAELRFPAELASPIRAESEFIVVELETRGPFVRFQGNDRWGTGEFSTTLTIRAKAETEERTVQF